MEDQHKNSIDNLIRARTLLANCEESGCATIQQLEIDKEKLINIQKNVDNTNNIINTSRRIIRKINNNDNKIKITAGILAGLVTVGAIITGVLLKKK
jgi:arsenate reductase-like glutaredoxin family protein